MTHSAALAVPVLSLSLSHMVGKDRLVACSLLTRQRTHSCVICNTVIKCGAPVEPFGQIQHHQSLIIVALVLIPARQVENPLIFIEVIRLVPDRVSAAPVGARALGRRCLGGGEVRILAGRLLAKAHDASFLHDKIQIVALGAGGRMWCFFVRA